MTEELKTAWELIAEHGLEDLKIVMPNYPAIEEPNFIIEFEDGVWKHEGIQLLRPSHESFNERKWKLYKPEPKMITWYRPKFYRGGPGRAWGDGAPIEKINTAINFCKSKEDWLKLNGIPEEKVSDEWETMEAPESWEQVDE